MKTFEVGKSYLINNIEKNYITVTKRTDRYLYFVSDYSGLVKKYRKWIYKDNLFKLGENILLDSYSSKGFLYFCFAANRKRGK